MKNKIYLLLTATMLAVFALATHTNAQAPAKQWDKRFGSSSNDFNFYQSLQQTSDGGYILGGQSNGGISGDKTQASQGDYDYWIVKTDASGIKLWDKRFGGSLFENLYSLRQTSDGGYIMGGYSRSGISGDKTQALRGGRDYWTVKTDANGIKLWDATFGGSADDNLVSLQQTTDGGYILGGHSASGISGDKTQASQGGEDFWIVKTDANGIKQWDKRFGGSGDDQSFSVQQTSDGGYILAGFSNSGISGDKTQASQGGYDYWIVKTDASGNKLWDKRFGGSNDENTLSQFVRQTSDGGYIVGGSSRSGISGDKTQASWGGLDYWVVKTDASGTKLWDARFGGISDELLFSVNQTSDGGYILGGQSNSGITGDKTQAMRGIWDFWIVKTDASGTKLWDARFGGSGGNYLHSVQQTSDGGYILEGESDSGISGDKTQASQGGMDYWIVKLAPDCPAAGTACDDGLYCTTGDVEDGNCNCAGTPVAIDDGIACTADACDEANDVVTHTPNNALCDDGNPNTTDICDATLGCQHNPNAPIPTLSEWGLILLALLTLSLVSTALVQRQPALAGVPGWFSIASFRIPFDKADYFSVLKFLVPVAIAGFFIVHFTIGTNGLLDFTGTMASAVIVGYIFHLIIGSKK